MGITSPEPESEFRIESEFRAKVYRMLALGLSTTEVENVLGRRIDWSLYSEETLKEIMTKTAPAVSLVMPPELTESLTGFYGSIKNITSLMQIQTALMENKLQDMRKFQKKLIRAVLGKTLFMLHAFLGFVTVLLLVLLVAIGVLAFR